MMVWEFLLLIVSGFFSVFIGVVIVLVVVWGW